MSDVVGRAVIQTVVDADLEAFYANMAKAEEVSGRAARTIVNNAGKATEAIAGIGTGATNLPEVDAATNKAIDRFKRLEAQVRMSTAAFTLMNATQKGAAADVLEPYAGSLIRATEAAKNEAKAQREVERAMESRKRQQDAIIASLERMLALQGAKSPLDALLYDANKLGVGDQAQKLVKQMQAAQGSMRDARVSANQLRQAYAQLPAQITDVVTSLASGSPAWLVMIQQGGQVKDSFGGIGNAAKALLSLLTPVRLVIGGVAAALGAVAYGYYAGRKEQDEFVKSLAMTGNAAGTTVGQLATMARAVSAATGATVGKSAEALNALVASGKVGSEVLEKAAASALRLERVGGAAVEDTVKQFALLGKDPVAGILRLNDGMNFLTRATFENIKALQDQGKTSEAAALAARAYADAVDGVTGKIEANLGSIERAWRGVKDIGKKAVDSLFDVGRRQGLTEQIAAIDALIEANARRQDRADSYSPTSGAKRQGADSQLESLKAQREQLKELVRLSGRAAEADAARARQSRAIEEAEKLTEAALSSQLQLTKQQTSARTTLETAGVDKTKIDAALNYIRQTSQAQAEAWALAGAKAEGAYSIASERIRVKIEELQSLTKQGLLTPFQEIEESSKRRADLLRAESALLSTQLAIAKDKRENDAEVAAILAKQVVNQIALKNEISATARATKEYMRALSEKETKAGEDEQQRIIKDLVDQDAAVQKLLKSEDQLAAERAANLRREAIDLEYYANVNAGFGGADEEQRRQRKLDDAERKRRTADLIDQQRAIKNQQELEKAAEAAAHKAQEEWDKVAEHVGSSLADAIMKGGKAARDYIRDLFRDLVLRPILMPITSAVGALVASATTGSAYAAEGSGSAVGIMSSLASSYSALSKAYEWYTGGGANSLTGSIAGYYGTFARSATGQALGLSEGGVAVGNNASAYVAPSLTSGGSVLGTAASYAAYAAIGQAIGRSISGGYSAMGGNSGSTAVNVGTAIGAIWGPIGSAIGAGIGGLVNRAFGRKAPEVTERGITGSFSDSGFSGSSYTDILEKGGWFRSDKRYTVTDALSADIDKALDAGAASVKASVTKYTEALGLPASQMKTVTDEFRVAITDDSGKNEQAIQAALAKYSDALVGAFSTDIEPFRKAGESVSDAIVRLGQNLSGVNDMLATLGVTALASSLSGADAASKLTDAFGGLSTMSSAVGAYYQAFYSKAEQTQNLARTIGDAFSSIGVSVPKTREEFKSLVSAQDLMTDSGRATFAALMGVSSAFDTLQKASEEVAAKRSALDIELLRAEGKELEAVALERQAELDALRELDPALAAVKEMIYAAVDAAKEADKWKNVWAGVDSVIGDFLGGQDLANYRAQRIQATLAAGGIDSSVEGIIGATKEDILALWNAVGVDGKQAILNAYSAWKTLEEGLAQTKIDQLLSGIGVSESDLLAAYNEINPAADNLVQAWRKTTDEIDKLQSALDEFTGTAAKSAIDLLRADISRRDGLKGVIEANRDTALETLVGRGTQEGVDALRKREAELWAEYASTGSPEVAQAITKITLDRVKLEGTVAQKELQATYDAEYQEKLKAYELAKATVTLEEAARKAQEDALQAQIDAAKRLKELAADSATFLGGLRAGSLSNLSYAGRLDQQKSLFEASLTTGKDAEQQLSAYLTQAQQMYGGATAAYSSIFTAALAEYQAAITSGASGADQTISTAEAQLKALQAMEDQAPELEKAVVDTSQAEIDAISALNSVFGSNLTTLNTSIDAQIAVLKEQLEALKAQKEAQETAITTYAEGVKAIRDELDKITGAVKAIQTTVETEAARA